MRWKDCPQTLETPFAYAITWLIIEAPGMKVLVDRQRRLDDLMFGKIGSPKASDPWAYLDAARKFLQQAE
jgi:hypothetical protein